MICDVIDRFLLCDDLGIHLFRDGIDSARAIESYCCRYGLNVAFRGRLEEAGLRFGGFDDEEEVRSFELPSRPFFIGALFQPERSALRGKVHPLGRAFLRASLAG